MAFSVLQLQKISETRQDRTKVTIDNYWTGVECWCYYCLDLSESDMKQITIKESLDIGKKHAASRAVSLQQRGSFCWKLNIGAIVAREKFTSYLR